MLRMLDMAPVPLDFEPLLAKLARVLRNLLQVTLVRALRNLLLAPLARVLLATLAQEVRCTSAFCRVRSARCKDASSGWGCGSCAFWGHC
jgi:hypothetical protein